MSTNRLVIKPIRVPDLDRGKILACKGTKVVCSNEKCRATIGELAVDVYDAINPAPNLIRFAPTQQRRAGQQAVCVRCGHGYYKKCLGGPKAGTFILSTEIGWVG